MESASEAICLGIMAMVKMISNSIFFCFYEFTEFSERNTEKQGNLSAGKGLFE